MNFSITALIIFIVVVLFVGALLISKGKFSRSPETNDPRRGLKPNATNYNQSMFSEDELKSMTKEEAKNFLEQLQKGDLTSLSPRDFAILKEKIKD